MKGLDLLGADSIKKKLFISFSKRDDPLATTLFTLLEMLLGHHAYLFKANEHHAGIKGGDDWRTKIRDELNNAHRMVVLATPAFVTERWFWIEAGGVWVRSTERLIVLASPKVEPSQIVPFDHKQVVFLVASRRQLVKETITSVVAELQDAPPKWTAAAERLLDDLLSLAESSTGSSTESAQGDPVSAKLRALELEAHEAKLAIIARVDGPGTTNSADLYTKTFTVTNDGEAPFRIVGARIRWWVDHNTLSGWLVKNHGRLISVGEGVVLSNGRFGRDSIRAGGISNVSFEGTGAELTQLLGQIIETEGAHPAPPYAYMARGRVEIELVGNSDRRKTITGDEFVWR